MIGDCDRCHRDDIQRSPRTGSVSTVKRFVTIPRWIFVGVIALGLAACGEGKVARAGYQGKPDTPPWDSPAAGGDKAQWERQIEARTLNQNEHERMR